MLHENKDVGWVLAGGKGGRGISFCAWSVTGSCWSPTNTRHHRTKFSHHSPKFVHPCSWKPSCLVSCKCNSQTWSVRRCVARLVSDPDYQITWQLHESMHNGYFPYFSTHIVRNAVNNEKELLRCAGCVICTAVWSVFCRRLTARISWVRSCALCYHLTVKPVYKEGTIEEQLKFISILPVQRL